MSKYKLFALLLFSLLAPFLLEAKEPNRYAVITLENQTPYRIYYLYRWGEGEREWKNSIKPHGTYVHWWDLKRPDWAPWFYLSLESSPDSWLRLSSFYSPNKKSKSGRVYVFQDEGEGHVREIKLHAKLYAD